MRGGPKRKRSQNGCPPKMVPKRKRSQNGCPPKMVPKRKRSQNGCPPKMVPKRKRSQNGCPPKMVPKRKRSQNGCPPKMVPKRKRSQNGCPPKMVPKRKRSQNGCPPKMVPKRKRSQNGCPPKMVPKRKRSQNGSAPKWSQNGSGPKQERSQNGSAPKWSQNGTIVPMMFLNCGLILPERGPGRVRKPKNSVRTQQLAQGLGLWGPNCADDVSVRGVCARLVQKHHHLHNWGLILPERGPGRVRKPKNSVRTRQLAQGLRLWGPNCADDVSVGARVRPPCTETSSAQLWGGLGWAGLGWAGLGWAGLGWAWVGGVAWGRKNFSAIWVGPRPRPRLPQTPSDP